ncbi:hypothetical protein GF389_06360 [Candidatus Dojkabacteria bacterium]|nr:hypothetical protein [Candidatus Dojkabacteria bacterium]
MNDTFHAKTIKKQAKKDFEGTWLDTAKYLKKSGVNIRYRGKGKRHPVIEQINQFRDIFLELGFNEYINPAIVEDEEVYKQYGPEAPLILDRVFYLAGLPREDIGIDDMRIQKIQKIIPKFKKFAELKTILREFKKGMIEGDDFIELLSTRLQITESQSTRLVNEVFNEFSELKPQPSHLTLRSHMTANWFGVLSRKQSTKMPVKLFSIGSRFRREQRQDENHLYESTSASLVIMNPKLGMEDGEVLVEKIIKKLELTDLKTIPKKTTSKYYAPGFDWEVYARHNGKEIEIANIGMYSPVALSNYKIKFPVLNLGFGVERIAMIKTGEKDIRKLVFPQHY